MEPGVYKVRGPNGAEVRMRVPSPGVSLAAFEAKVDSGELVIVDGNAGKPKAAPKKTAAKGAG